MAKREEFTLSLEQRRRRSFSESFRKEKVRELELGLTSPSDLKKAYEVSYTTIYRWVDKFGSMKSKKEKLIVEVESDSARLVELKKRIAELERAVGQKQIMIDFQQKMIELAEDEYGIDIKKKYSGEQLNTFGNTGK